MSLPNIIYCYIAIGKTRTDDSKNNDSKLVEVEIVASIVLVNYVFGYGMGFLTLSQNVKDKSGYRMKG